MGIGFADDIALDLHVHHDEVGAVERVGHDTAYEGRSQDDCVGLFLIEEPPHRHLIGEVQLLVATPHQVGIAS